MTPIETPVDGDLRQRLKLFRLLSSYRFNPPHGGTGDRGVDQPGDSPSDAKKNGMTKRKIEYWVIPPDADGEFVANMEEVLETYETAYDPDCPVVCMDEQPVQLIGETRVPIPATKEHPERVDYEYERKGTASILMFAEPLSGFRQTTARPRRTKDDWAHEVAHLLDTRYAEVERIALVCDNSNTHMALALLELSEVNHSFPPFQIITMEVLHPSQNSHFLLSCVRDRPTWQSAFGRNRLCPASLSPRKMWHGTVLGASYNVEQFEFVLIRIRGFSMPETDRGVKSDAMRIVDSLPEDATWDDLMYRIYVRQCVDAGIADAEAGRVVDVCEVRRRFGLTP